MRRLAAETPGLAQLIAPPSVPTISTNPSIGMSPTSLSFSAQQGGGNPPAQSLTISNTGGGSLNWSATSTAAWLTLSTTSGNAPSAVTVNIIAGTLAAGSYAGTVVFNATGASTVVVPVTLTITAAPLPPSIGVSPTSFSFTAQAGTTPATQTLTIRNTGGGTLNWTATDNAPWLTVLPASGSGNGTITLSVATTSLSAGTYTGSITLSGTGVATPVSVPVGLTVTAAPAPPVIGTSPTSLSFTVQSGNGNPATQSLNISNAGGGTLSWSASSNTTWLTVSPTSGSGNGVIAVHVQTGILAPGTHTGQITLNATGASSVAVPVTFTITASPTITLSPTNLNFSGTQGGTNPANQTVALSTTGGTVNWTASSNASWLAVSPGTGNTNGSLIVSVNTSGLSAGPYNGTITVSASGSASKTVAVSLTVNTPVTASVTLTWTPVTDNDLAGYKIYRRIGTGTYGASIASIPASSQANVSSYIATGLLPRTTYFFVVTAFDSAGNESSPSTPEASVTIP